MFSIQKKQKIQIRYKAEGIHTREMLGLRKWLNKPGTIQTIIRSTTEQINQITSLTSWQETRDCIEKYFPSNSSDESTQQLSALLKKFPHIFHDLIRVVSKYRAFNERNWHVSEEHESDVGEVFLFEKRPQDIWTKIPGFIKIICKNSNFVEFTHKQHSLLDVGYFWFSKIHAKDRKTLIRNLIETSLVENIPPQSRRNPKHFWLIREKICRYISTIYGINTRDFEGINDIEALVDRINKWLGNPSAKTQKLSWKVLQGFYSWWAIEEIEELDVKYRKPEFQEAIQGKIQTVFWNISNITSEEVDGTTVNHGSITYKGNTIDISWRIKSIESILMKNWEDEDYGYISSLRDKLGLSLTFPDDMSDDDISELMRTGSTLLADRGYILKNKWLLPDDVLTQINYESWKTPLFTSTKPWGDPKMQNASQSGFSGIEIWHSKVAIGTEIQYSKKSAMEWKKRENAIFKFRALFDSLLRGEYVDTPLSIYTSIKQRIAEPSIQNLVDPDTKENLGLKTHGDLMKYLIYKKLLLPYYGRATGQNAILLSTKTHKNKAEEEWDIRPLWNESNQDIYNNFMTYINWLK